MKNNWTIPAGMRDWLPNEAEQKRKLISGLLDQMALWGYEEIATPVLEFYKVLVKGETDTGPDYLYKLIDRDGSILALRPEMTTPIARLASGKLPGKPPWRIKYGAEVFRYEEIQTGKQREFSQVGVELLGRKGPEADSEVLALAIECLKEAGLEQFTISLGHMGVLQGLLQSLTGKEEELNEVRRLVLEKDFVGLQKLLAKAGFTEGGSEGLVGLITRPLTLPELEAKVGDFSEEVQGALQEVITIIKNLEVFGFAKYIQIDLSTLRSQTYYTGMVFEVYTTGIGYPIGGGGRYDHLLHRFGWDCPATGFALGVERLLLSLAGLPKGEQPILLTGAEPSKVIIEGQSLRAEGMKVITELSPMDQNEAQQLAQEKGVFLKWIPGGKY